MTLPTNPDRVEAVDVLGPATTESGPTDDDGLGCLHTPRGNLPLTSLDADVTITGLTAGIRLVQGFRNPYHEPLEATYIFPLPPRAAVTALRMEADGRAVDARLEERAKARAAYDEAIGAGQRASIAEEERPGVFTMRVGNILPGERVTVTLTLAGELPYEDGAATFRLPLVVAPRYIPGAPLAGEQAGDGVAVDTDAVPDASRISPPVLLPGFPNPVRLGITVDIDPAGLPLSRVASSLHAMITERTRRGLRVRIAPGDRADRDFVLRLAYADSAVATSLAVLPDPATGGGDAEGSGTFALTLLPPAHGASARDRDVVVVLDRSGSMGGWKMVAARRAAARIVDTLRSGDRFAVLAFDHDISRPAGLPRAALAEANDRNRFRAVEFLAGLDARGGTELLEPLREALRLLSDTGRDRVVVLVTDGQVGNEDQLLAGLGRRASGIRVHTVGIDRAVNEGFLRRLAGSSGRCELVESEDRLDEAMRHIHHRIDTPVVTGLRLAAVPGGLAVTPGLATPDPLPDLFAGAPVVIMGRCSGPATGTVLVTGEIVGERGGSAVWQAEVTAAPSTAPALRALWARARVRDLEDRYLVVEWNHEALEREIVETSLRHGVLSRFTAFVAVDDRVVNETGEVRTIVQPVAAPSDWDGAVALAARPPAAAAMPAASPARPAAAFAYSPAPAPRAPRGRGRAKARQSSRQAERVEYSPPPAEDTGVLDDSGPVAAPPPDAVPGGGGPFPVASPRASLPPWGDGETLAEFVADALTALRGAAGEPPAAKAAVLSDLASRIDDGLPRWKDAGAAPAALRTLERLRDEIRRTALDLAVLDAHVRRALTALEPLAAPPREAGARTPFWKR